MYLYLKALHIIFVVTWFAGLFYAPRLVIYFIEAKDKPAQERMLIQQQMQLMLKRLWLGITWPSAIITLILGMSIGITGNWFSVIFQNQGKWFLIKLLFVLLLYAYHYSLHRIYKSVNNGSISWTAQQMRYWNELPTLLLFVIVFLVVVKQLLSVFWAVSGVLLLMVLLVAGILIYKKMRKS